MKRKILFAGDLHKRMKDISTIRGYMHVCVSVQHEIMRILREEGFTDFISLGDWFDRGYGSDVAAALAHTDIDRELAEQMNGNFYGLIGNHIRINMDSNPELFLIQPHSYFKSRHKVHRSTQIMKTPDRLDINGASIYFMHYNKDAKDAGDYKPMLNPESKYNIAIFHTPMIIPTMNLHRMGLTQFANENSKIGVALENIDLAIVGDIHKPLGTFTINKADGTSTTMIVPGSLTNTDAGLGSRHNTIDMPVVEIDDDGAVSLSYRTIDLQTNRLTFMEKTSSSVTDGKMKSLYGNNKAELYENNESTTFVGAGSISGLSMNAFMQEQNYTATDKALIRAVLHEPENVNKMVTLYQEELK